LCRVSLDIQRTKTELKFARAWKFWYVYKYHSTNNSSVRLLRGKNKDLKYIYMKTVESNDYRETSGVDKDTNGILVTM